MEPIRTLFVKKYPNLIKYLSDKLATDFRSNYDKSKYIASVLEGSHQTLEELFEEHLASQAVGRTTPVKRCAFDSTMGCRCGVTGQMIDYENHVQFKESGVICAAWSTGRCVRLQPFAQVGVDVNNG